LQSLTDALHRLRARALASDMPRSSF